MKFTLKGPFKENTYSLMRKVGYIFQGQEKSEFRFIRPLERSGYPRFHVYLKINPTEGKQELIFNLHLDQKKPIYKDTSAHSAEYEGEVIEKEIERIKQILKI